MLRTRDGQTWTDWADSMAGRLASRAAEAERMRALHPETMAEAEAAGFFALLAPVTAGGMGASFAEFLEVIRRLANGCASSAWVLSFLSLHAWMLCKFPAQAQARFFADGKMPLAPAPLAPTGRAERVDGGFRVSGRWEWATGINHSDWVLVNAIDSETGEPRYCAMTRDEVEVEDVWLMSGMASTGSNAVVVSDVFVPDYMTLPAREMAAGASPGEALHPGSTLNYPLRAVLTMVAATPAVGAAEAALAWYTERMMNKQQAFGGGARQAEIQTTHMRLGEALAEVRAMRLVWEDARAAIERVGPGGASTPIPAQAALRLAAAQVVRLSNRAIDIMAASAGASASQLSNPLQRQLRDVQVIRGHVMYDWDRTCVLAGKVELGFPTGPADLI
ncbi:acyl-CoA dehydrogenase family protein [Novosphingobium sp.]|uniref:acyl-CoA dehydrogenase family protein n=1 Tax=Novosphingobium sp. TaxID=1874826 RepID=UPI001EB3C732|nr:acyl-CoA dehydrogenase family protein [Novosphingobium sp.]MBK9009343.1 acyl-CoA dehydrogenase family protein [Novosphingobium sp.]